MNTFFNDKQAAAYAEKLYEAKLESLNIQYEYKQIETTFGLTNIVIAGTVNKPPLLLIHGSNGCAPIAIEALMELLNDYRVYAVDVIGQPNKSEASRLNLMNDDYGKWIYEITARLNLNNLTIVGISFGGFISYKALLYDESKIKNAFLIVPAGIINGNPFKAILKVFLPMKLYKKTRNKKYVHRFLNVLFTEKDKFAIQFLSIIFLHFDMDFSPIPLITKKEAARIKTPIYFIASKKDLFFPGEKLLKRVSKIFPSLTGTHLLENSKHVPSTLDNRKICMLIKNANKLN